MIDFKMFGGFALGLTDERTFAISRLKIAMHHKCKSASLSDLHKSKLKTPSSFIIQKIQNPSFYTIILGQ